MSTVTIKRLGHQGDGIADGPEGDIYVPFTLPGETVEGDIVGDHMDNVRVITPSPDRVKAPCSHFKSCGGCSLQHAADGFLAVWKTDIIKSALTAKGLKAPFRPIVTSPANARRRATLAGRRTKKGAMVGFHAKASDALVPVPSCTLLHPDILRAFPIFEELTRLGGSRKGTVSIAVTYSATGLDVAMGDVKTADGPLLVELGGLCEKHHLARLSWNGDVIATRTAPVQRFATTSVTPPPGAFLQATEAGQSALTEAVCSIIGDAKQVVDLFAGCGTFSLPLAGTAAVHAVESDDAYLAALDAGWRNSNGLREVTTEARDLFRRPLLVAELNKFDAVVIDPPRAGAKAQTEVLAQSKVARIAFVSCNYVTFARDAAVLVAAGFRIDWVQPVDQFRWSAHVELVAAFSRD